MYYSRKWSNYWYWRTKEQKEIDFIEESDGRITAFEFKWSARTKVKPPKQFLENYPNATFEVITPDDYEDFLL